MAQIMQVPVFEINRFLFHRSPSVVAGAGMMSQDLTSRSVSVIVVAGMQTAQSLEVGLDDSSRTDLDLLLVKVTAPIQPNS